MTKLLMVAAAAGALFAATPALAQNAAVEAPIKAFGDAFSKGDMATAMATHVPAGAVIVDELPPYVWTGATAFSDWGASFAKDAAARGLTEPNVTIGAPTREEVTGDRAYVIVPATYSFKQKGVAMREAAQMTFTLAKTEAGWKITSWTWTGPAATAVK